MRVAFIRHGKTQGNLEKRYVGRTDEPLCEEGRRELANRIGGGICSFFSEYKIEEIKIFSSSMRRCVETAEMLFPGCMPEIYDDLRECDFGDFEYKNYEELIGNPDYQRWIDSGGTAPFPNGEDMRNFRARSVAAFDEAMSGVPAETELCIFIVHGGTIMSVMSEKEASHSDYFSWRIANGSAILCEYDGETMYICYLEEGKKSGNITPIRMKQIEKWQRYTLYI